jgi:catechol 2,3-dioxygenase-like lactoylglutathione lyase family enzyme
MHASRNRSVDKCPGDRGRSYALALVLWTVASAPACSDAPAGTGPSMTAVGTVQAPTGASAPPDETKPASRDVQAPRSDVSDDDAGLGSAVSSRADAGRASANPRLGICSGCAQDIPDEMDMTIHLHHVHLNSADAARSMDFYERFLAAERTKLNDVTDALHAAPILLLIDETEGVPVSRLPTALQHLGWGATDVAAWYQQARAQGVIADTRGGTLFNTFETPSASDPDEGRGLLRASGAPECFPIPDEYLYMYVLGPDQERVEVWTGSHARVSHMHFTTADLAASMSWYERFLGLTTTQSSAYNATFFLDDIFFFIEPIGRASDYQPTDDHVLGHFALSVTDLDAWLQRAREQNIEIVAEPAEVHGFKSFFVRGPDGMLIELVQASRLPELCSDLSAGAATGGASGAR